jgi:hypothetical protein
MKKLQVVSVENKVLWADASLPFRFNVGEPTRLGVFLTPKASEKTVEAEPMHSRSAVMGRALFRDEHGNTYRDIDAKGIGFIRMTHTGELRVSAPKLLAGESQGIVDYADAQKEKETAEEFLAAGIRTARPIAHIWLKQIVDKDGDRITLKQAIKRGMIKKGTRKAVLVLRAFGTKRRLLDAMIRSNAKDKKRLLDDARGLVGTELGEDLTPKQYAEWFAKTLAEQFARMHNNGWAHGFAGEHNTTLDARIVDLDHVKRIVPTSKKDREKILADYDDLIESVDRFANEFNQAYHKKAELRGIAHRAYTENIRSKGIKNLLPKP